jgi:hypothetical protein
MTDTIIQTGGLPDRLPRGKTAERILFAELLSRLETMQASQTAFQERWQGRLTNNSQLVETATFDSTGYLVRSFGAPVGSVYVDNQSGHDITVVTGTRGGTVPTGGVGVFLVKNGKDRSVAIGTTSFTLFGTPNDTVSFQVWTLGVQPGAG